MLLAIDAGNTRLKWALHDGQAWRARGACASGEAAQAGRAWRDWPAPARIVVSNVAGPAVGAAIETAAAAWPVIPEFIVSRGAQCGVRSSYEDPAQLGCDRWAALLGAHRCYPGSCLVVNAGTAMTVDALTDEGLFLGGIITPGVDLMRRALDAHTAGLRWQPGEVRFFPANTGDAIMSGAAHALAGAIERMAAFMREGGEVGLRVLLGGGSAALLQPLLSLEVVPVDNLVLEGLLAIALEKA